MVIARSQKDEFETQRHSLFADLKDEFIEMGMLCIIKKAAKVANGYMSRQDAEHLLDEICPVRAREVRAGK